MIISVRIDKARAELHTELNRSKGATEVVIDEDASGHVWLSMPGDAALQLAVEIVFLLDGTLVERMNNNTAEKWRTDGLFFKQYAAMVRGMPKARNGDPL